MKPMKNFTDKQLISAYRIIRKRIKLKEDDLDKKLAKFRDRQHQIAMELTKRLDARESTNVKADDGAMAYFSTRATASIFDRAAFEEYVSKTGQLDLFQARVVTSRVTELQEMYPDKPIPGVKVERHRELKIKEPSSTKGAK